MGADEALALREEQLRDYVDRHRSDRRVWSCRILPGPIMGALPLTMVARTGPTPHDTCTAASESLRAQLLCRSRLAHSPRLSGASSLLVILVIRGAQREAPELTLDDTRHLRVDVEVSDEISV